jgi:hypothetical protein
MLGIEAALSSMSGQERSAMGAPRLVMQVHDELIYEVGIPVPGLGGGVGMNNLKGFHSKNICNSSKEGFFDDNSCNQNKREELHHLRSQSLAFEKLLHRCMEREVWPMIVCICINIYVYMSLYAYIHTHTNRYPYMNLHI